MPHVRTLSSLCVLILFCTELCNVSVLVLARRSVDTLDEAIQLVNNNPWGNGTAIFTSSGAHARKYQHEIEVGGMFLGIWLWGFVD